MKLLLLQKDTQREVTLYLQDYHTKNNGLFNTNISIGTTRANQQLTNIKILINSTEIYRIIL